MTGLLYWFWFDQPKNIWWGSQIIKLLIGKFSPFSCYFLPFRTWYLPKHPIFSILLLLPPIQDLISPKAPYFLHSPFTSSHSGPDISQSTLFSPFSFYFLPFRSWYLPKHPIFSILLLLPPIQDLISPKAPYFLHSPVTSSHSGPDISQNTLFSPFSCYFLPFRNWYLTKHHIFSILLLLPPIQDLISPKAPYFLHSPVTASHSGPDSQSTLFSPFSCYYLPFRTWYIPKHPIFERSWPILFPQCERPSLNLVHKRKVKVLHTQTLMQLDSKIFEVWKHSSLQRPLEMPTNIA